MNGILNLRKPPGWSSRDVVNHVSKVFGRRVKCGHAGTLDPLATGVLLVCVGKATQLVPLIHDHDKSYLGEFLLGKQSNTDDTEGELIDVPRPASLTAETIEAVLPEFMGEIQQFPPIFSAVKVNGERAYKSARRGENVEVPPRTVRISDLQLTRFDGDRMQLMITCGTGTYIRSVGRDLARRVETEAVMCALERTRIGPYAVEDALDVDKLSRDSIAEKILPPLTALPHLKQHEIDAQAAQKLRTGQKLDCPDSLANQNLVAAVDQERSLVAIVRVQGEQLAPQIVFPLSQC